MNKNISKIYFILLSIFILILFWSINTYNTLINLNENIKSQWGKVDNAYQRRLDLIPNLVNIIKGATMFEKKTLIDVIEARSKASSIIINPKNLNQKEINKFQNQHNNLNNTLNKLLITVEKYPEIKSIQNFSELQSQIEGTENRINIERNRFNENVQYFNQYRNHFPEVFISNIFSKFSEKGYFKSQYHAKNTPIINFN